MKLVIFVIFLNFAFMVGVTGQKILSEEAGSSKTTARTTASNTFFTKLVR